MENLITNFNILIPMVLLVVLGKILSKINFINRNYVYISSKLVFKITLPITLFISTSRIDFSSGVNANTKNLIVYGSLVMLLSFVVATIVSKYLNIDDKTKGAFIQGTCRSNFAVVGYPILLSVFGDEVILPMALFTIFLIGITNGVSVIVLTFYDKSNGKIKIRTLIKNILLNPLIDSLIIGFLFSCFTIRLPVFISSTLSQISGLTTPLALVNIGAIFSLSFETEKIKPLVTSVAVKSIIMPLVAVFVGVCLGFRGPFLGIIFIALISPAPPSSFVMAKMMNSDENLAANIVVASTIASAIVIFIGITLLQSLSLI
ncbi:MAG: AEC family transporter [Bacillota bacterium]|nr:AEC family transporter [Bacillota bacterium]MDD3851103.1 AEC family transporter [Bacillota bacterium]